MEIARRQFAEGQSRLHIVAPPGSGKTVLGLYLWAECVRKPALVLSPNSAIQAQWTARTDLFEIPPEATVGDRQVVSLDGRRPALLTSLTYQAVTMPQTGNADADVAAIELWRDSLVESEHAQDAIEAEVWIRDLQKHNPDYFEQRLSTYRKKVREQTSLAGETLGLLHANSQATLERLRDANVGLLILDECHHLLGHWGRVLAEASEMLGNPVVIGLTATPPDRTGKKNQDVERYDEFFGPVDYEVPVPAVVKDGFLAPYQDLVYFVRPTTAELSFVANADDSLNSLVERLCMPREVSAAQAEELQRKATDKTGGAGQGSELDDEDAAHLNNVSENSPVTVLAEQSLASEQFTEEMSEPSAEDSEEHEPTAKNGEDEMEPEYRCAESLPQWIVRVLSERRLSSGLVRDWRSFYKRDPIFADAARLFLNARQIDLPDNVPRIAGNQGSAELGMEVFVPVLDRYIRHRLRRSQEPADHRLASEAIRRLRILGIQVTETGAQACASPVGRVLAYSRAKTDGLLDILAAEMAARGDNIRAVVVTDYEKSSAVSAEVQHLLDKESGGAVAAFKSLVDHPVTDLLNPVLVTGSSVLVDDDAIEQFNHAAMNWLGQKGFDVQLTDEPTGSFHVINGRGRDWCPRVYVEMITDMFQKGLTRCLVGTRGLLGEGWDANKINVLVDLTTVKTSMSVNQLRGRSIRLDPEDSEKLASNWDVVCIAPEFAKGLDDYKRFEAKHRVLYGVTDDGAIEKGVGHVHAAFTELKPEGIEQSTQVLNQDMLARVARRDHFRSLWRIGQPYRSEPVRAVEAKLPNATARDFPPFRGRRVAWNAESLAAAIGTAVLFALNEVSLIEQRHQMHVGKRAGDYVRIFLDGASEEDNAVFGAALREALGPIGRPRYVIPRHVDRREDSWLSKILPEILGRFFRKHQDMRVMLHAVPSVLSKNKEMVAVYQRYWNRFVSNGQAVFALQGAGEQLLEKAKQSAQVPTTLVREKEIFL